VGGRPVREFGRVRNIAEVESFDVRSETWREHASMPEPREHLGVAALDGQVYAFAGRLPDGSISARLDRYDPATDTWQRLKDAPFATSGVALLPLDGGLYTAGGEEPHSVRVFGGTVAYRPGEDGWTRMPNLPKPLHGYAATTIGRRVYVFTGSTCPGFHPTDEVWSSTPPAS
jgi:N-acetylneuraminic acid mutarotase